MPHSCRWLTQSENFRPLAPRRVRKMTHKYTHKLQTFLATGSRRVAQVRSRPNHRKSFIQRSFGTNRHQTTQAGSLTGKPASLGLEPRQRDPESLVLPLHHEAKAPGGQDLKLNLHVSQADRKPTRSQFNPASFPHLRARLRPQDNFRFSRPTFVPSGPYCRSFRRRASDRGEKE